MQSKKGYPQLTNHGRNSPSSLALAAILDQLIDPRRENPGIHSGDERRTFDNSFTIWYHV